MNLIVFGMVITIGFLHWGRTAEATVDSCITIQALTQTKDMEEPWEVPEAAKMISEYKAKEDDGPWMDLANYTVNRHGAQWLFDLKYDTTEGHLMLGIDATYSSGSSEIPNAIQAWVEMKDKDNLMSKKNFWHALFPYGNTTDAWQGLCWIPFYKDTFMAAGRPLSLIIKARISSSNIEVDNGSDSRSQSTVEATTGLSSMPATMQTPRVVFSWALGNPGNYYADSKQPNSMSEFGTLRVMNGVLPGDWILNARLRNFGDFKSIELEVTGYSSLEQYALENFQINATISGGSVMKPMTDLSRYLRLSKRVDVMVTDQDLDEFKSKITFQIVFDPVPQHMAKWY